MAGQDAPGHRLYGCSPSSYRVSEGQPKLLSIAPGEPSPAGNERLHESSWASLRGCYPFCPPHCSLLLSKSCLFTHSLYCRVFCKMVTAKTLEDTVG